MRVGTHTQWRTELLATWFRRFADQDPLARAPGVRELALAISDDPEVLALARMARRGQPVPNLFLACARYIRLTEAGTPERHNVDEELDYPRFRNLVLAHSQEVQRLMTMRRVQTNEAGRSAPIRLAIGAIAASMGSNSPLALIEIGASAGLNLFWNKYSYDFSGTIIAGEPSVELTCALTGDGSHVFQTPVPQVQSRVGIDASPLSVSSAADRLWLEAFIPSSDRTRRDRLRAAMAFASVEAPRLVAGDALPVSPEVIAGTPLGCVPFVFHSHTTYQWAPDEREALLAILHRVGRTRAVWYAHQEPREPEHGGERDDHLMIRGYADGGEVLAADLGTCAQNGSWVRWSPISVGA